MVEVWLLWLRLWPDVGYIILLYCLYYFNVLYVKDRTFDVRYIIK